MNRVLTVFISAVLLVLLAQTSSRAQEDGATPDDSGSSRHSIGLNIGFNDVHQKDEFLSPVIFSGAFYAVGLSYDWKTPSHMHAVEAFFGNGTLNSDIQPRDVTVYVGHFLYAYTHVVDTWNIGGKPLELSLGAGLSTFVSNTDFNATDIRYNATTYDQSWYWSHAADIRIRGEYSLGSESVFSIQLALQLAQLVSRPGNGHYFNGRNLEVHQNFLNAAKQGRWDFLWDNVAMLGECEYRHRLAEHLDARGIYRFRYVSSDRPSPLGFYVNTAAVGLLWVI